MARSAILAISCFLFIHTPATAQSEIDVAFGLPLIPVSVGYNSSSGFYVSVGGEIRTPIGSFKIGANWQRERTDKRYIYLIDGDNTTVYEFEKTLITVDIPREATLYMKKDGNIEIVLKENIAYSPPPDTAPGYTTYSENACAIPLLGGFQLQFGSGLATHTGTLIMYGCEGYMSISFFNPATNQVETVDQTMRISGNANSIQIVGSNPVYSGTLYSHPTYAADTIYLQSGPYQTIQPYLKDTNGITMPLLIMQLW